MRNFDATIQFTDGVILEVFINSEGFLESFFYSDAKHQDEQDYCDGSICTDLSDNFVETMNVAKAISIACRMSDKHLEYEKRPYMILSGVDFV